MAGGPQIIYGWFFHEIDRPSIFKVSDDYGNLMDFMNFMDYCLVKQLHTLVEV